MNACKKIKIKRQTLSLGYFNGDSELLLPKKIFRSQFFIQHL
jgi:hypothetical protein